jgi:hypothetical protein
VQMKIQINMQRQRLQQQQPHGLTGQQPAATPRHVALTQQQQMPNACYPHYAACASTGHPPHAPHAALPRACVHAVAHSMPSHFPCGFAVPAPAPGQPFEPSSGVAASSGAPGACGLSEGMGHLGPPLPAAGAAASEGFGLPHAPSPWSTNLPRQ